MTINSGQAVRADVKDFPQNDPIGILLEKRDDKTDKNKPQGSASLENAEFTIKYYSGIYHSDPAVGGITATKEWVLKTDEDGFAAYDPVYKVSGSSLYTNSNGTAALPLGTVTIQESKAPKGYSLNPDIYVRQITSDGTTESVHTYNEPTIPESVLRGGVRIEKWDTQLDRKESQGGATLSGAELQIVSLNRNQVVVDGKTYEYGETVMTVTTDENGAAQTKKDALPYGDYRMKEVNPPEGYNNTGIIERDFSIREEGVIVNLNTTDTAIKNNVIRGGVEIEKWDKEKNQRKAQGSASLTGAQFQLISLNDHPVLVAGTLYQKQDVITTLTTDENGRAKTEAAYLPYGTYKCKEITPPTGYNAAGVLEREFTIKKEGATVKLNTTDTAIKNEVIRGDLQLVKFGEDLDEEEDQKTPLAGIVFSITSKTTGDVFEIVTDKHGYASTKQLQISDRGNLVYDTYIVHEETNTEGLKPVKDFEITIANEGETLYYILEDKLIVALVRLEKMDATTGKVISMANTEFALLDGDKNPITMTTHYPNETVHKTFKTDESGTFTLPEKLKVGTYYWRELQAPNGYLQGQDLQFEIKEGHSWEAPFVVQYEDTPAMGKITLHKTDEETGVAIAGTRFEVRAAEDIVTGDGTIRLRKGQLAQELVTDELGNAQTKPLFLGTYKVKEIAQTGGFILSDTEHKVQLSYKDQNTELVVESLSITNLPTKVKIIKVDGETKEPLAGVSFQVWNKAMGKEPDEGMTAQMQYTTDKDGVIVLQYLVPGTYCVQEVETLPGYVLNEQIFEVVISADGRIDGQDLGVLEIENIPTKLIGTKATDKDTGTQEAVPKKETTFVDTVEFKNLQLGETYTIKGILMDKSTGKPLLIQGKEVTAEKTFAAVVADGTQDVEFVFDATGLNGKDVVVFERVYTRGVEIAAHEDLKDQGQTIRFPESGIRTKAEDKDTGTQEAITKPVTTIVDTVTYENLIVGQTYTLRGTLMDKSTGKPLLVKEKSVTAEKTFTPEKKSGEVALEFVFDATNLKGKTVVVFETLFVEETEVAAHEDLEDRGQTIQFPEHSIKTTARNKETGTKEVIAKKQTTIVDRVEYTGLIPKQSYTVKGILMDKSTGKELRIDGKPVTAEKTLIPEKSEGSVELSFNFDSSELNGTSVVVFERLYAEDIQVAAHTDLNDEKQTVKVRVGKLITKMPEQQSNGMLSPKTGDTTKVELAVWILALAACVTVAGITVYKRRRKQDEE